MSDGKELSIRQTAPISDSVSVQDGFAREVTRREMLRMVVPSGVFPSKGHLILDRIQCSACALCAQECLTGALTVDGTESVSLTFQDDLCDSCGLCLDICPEKCLKLESGNGKAGTVILFSDDFARCQECGAVIGSRAMVERVRSKLGVADSTIVAKQQLCPECKGRVGLQSSRPMPPISDKDITHG